MAAAINTRLATEVLAERTLKSSFRAFLAATAPNKPYLWGRHTLALANALQRISDRVDAGKPTYQIVIVPPRSGKSDQASRRFPAWYLWRNPRHEVILASYASGLATDLSHDCRRIYREFGAIDDTRGRVDAWRTKQGGGLYAVGLGGTITGRGAHCLVIDDYLKGREEAESELIRERVWDSFRNDLWTRLAPVHSVVIVATRWHLDDLVGRILREAKDNPDFPSFSVLRFPAWDESDGWLFPERFSAEYYKAQRAAVGSYAWEALYQGDPQPRGGNLFAVDDIQIVNEFPHNGALWCRGWDLASTSKERYKDDPDYTVGVKLARVNGSLWIDDVCRGQWDALEREKRILDVADRDGGATRVGIESVAGYKDAAVRLKQLLRGKAVVAEERPDKDKVARACVLEPLFESGNVVLRRAPWNEAFLAEIAAFPRGRHDDQVDAMVVAHRLSQRRCSVEII